jgi:DUF4097 and DUF4098 domain-containing protein YvlB
MKKVLLLVSLILCGGCVDQGVPLVKEEVLEVFEGSTQAEISLDFVTHNGYIDIYLWDSETYTIEATKWARAATSSAAKEKAENIQVNFSEREESGGITLNLEVIHEINNTGANISVYLPKKSFGTVDLSSTNGHVTTEEITASDVSLTTTNGHIKASVTADDIRVTSTNGSIDGYYQGEDVYLKTTNGGIDVQCGDGGTYTVVTTNGSVSIQAGSRGDIDISTSNARINVTVAGDFAFDLRTSNGRITIDADTVTYTLDSRDHKKGSTAEEFDISITASTSNGDITAGNR